MLADHTPLLRHPVKEGNFLWRAVAVDENVAVRASGNNAKPQLSIVRLQIIQSKTVRSVRFQQISITS
jgi:hypothetical protein